MGTATGADRSGTGAPPDAARLAHAIRRRVLPLLRTVGLADHEVGCTVEGSTACLRVTVFGPAVASSVEQAIGVRVLDAIRADGRTFGTVDVECRFG